MLFDANILTALVPWLNNKQNGILVPVLECLSVLVHGNEVIADELMSGKNIFFFSINLISTY